MYILLLALTCLALTALYITYQRHFHPLASYPGPFWASLTDFWNAYQFRSGQHPYTLNALHEQYGPVVLIWTQPPQFRFRRCSQYNFRQRREIMPKTEVYDTFGSRQFPNLFNQTDMGEHAKRRRYLLKNFSSLAVEKVEGNGGWVY
ncbi:Putative cytochrome P450 superfamily [Septoria linicola]|uniref:Cytochrome P450 superfamily n=1 Tax=Septoria linicola TaxID=215465 RepID=A0A9Q9AVL9_9PEZI|nr:putative cytochrome P450 superfamily [Septoria linicola]USW56269.1 Putative cytochrome P450 superfamily [Septoria linicola]